MHHGSSFKYIHLIAKQILKLNNAINRLKVILYYSLLLLLFVY